METYQEILDRMRRQYADKSGGTPDEAGDIGIRLQVLAGEIYCLQAGIEWVRREAFPQTAQGEQLDRHGAQRGLARKPAQKAQGVLHFCRYLPLSFDLVIPKGTVCAAYGDEAVEYETTQDVSLPAGDLAVGAPAQAVEAGSRGNAASNYINTLVTPVNGIQYVMNHGAFTGGAEAEDDEAYRQRVLEAFSRPILMGNPAYYEALARAVPGVTKAQAVAAESGGAAVYLWGEGQAPDEALLAAATEALSREKPLGAALTIQAATTRKCNVMATMKMRPGLNFAEAKERAKAALGQWFDQREIGGGVYTGDLARVILGDSAIGKLTLNNAIADYAGAAGVLPIMGVVSLTEAA